MSGRLIVVCGLPGAGKTTLARRLEGELRAIRLSPDEWMPALGIDLWDEAARGKIEALQWSLGQRLLALGHTVIIEWGTWGRSERDALRLGARALGAAVELRYLDAPVEVLFARVQARGLEDPPMTLDDLRRYAEVFQRPTPEEQTLFDAPPDLQSPGTFSRMKLKLGLPKGSLQEPTFALFGRAGYSIKVSARSYQPVIDDDTIEPVLLRPQEIPMYVQQGILDAGLTGKDWIEDCGAGVHEVCELRYSKMTNNPIRVVLAVHEDSPIHSVKDLQGLRVATEYVRLTQRYLDQNGVSAGVEFSWGADEVKVPTLVDAIVVNTETGNSLRAHNLRIVDTLLTSTTRFVASPAAWQDDWKRERIESLEILLTGAMNAAKLVGLKMNLPSAQKDAILAILPAVGSPTLSPLADPAWLAAETILSELQVRELIPALKRAGATGLVEYPLNKVIY